MNRTTIQNFFFARATFCIWYDSFQIQKVVPRSRRVSILEDVVQLQTNALGNISKFIWHSLYESCHYYFFNASIVRALDSGFHKYSTNKAIDPFKIYLLLTEESNHFNNSVCVERFESII